jgi:hypothetical protein
MSRDLWLKLRVTAQEKTAFELAAIEAGMSLSDYIRHQLLHGRIRRTAEERDAVRQLARIGSNLNQLARWVNMQKDHAEVIEVLLCLDHLRDEVKTIVEARPCT